MNWNSSPHPISDIRDWNNRGRLELRPSYQRKEVWSERAKIMLMDSIFKGIPIPKVYLESELRNSDTYRIVIDGQQRINAILKFINNEFSLKYLDDDSLCDKYYRDLSEDQQGAFLQYKIDINEISGADEQEIRELYSRVNKYIVPLTKQELRRSDFPGTFLNLAEEVTLLPFFEKAKIFTVANRRRQADVEYCSELLAILLDGIQNKKQTLDSFYIEYSNMSDEEYSRLKNRFILILEDIFTLIPWIDRSRFRKKSDFYSLFAAINQLHIKGFALVNENVSAEISLSFEILNDGIEPNSEIKLYRDYAIKCVSDANTIGSRTWRKDFILHFINGVYNNTDSIISDKDFFLKLMIDIDMACSGGMCPPACWQCAVCDEDMTVLDENAEIVWNEGELRLFTNIKVAHRNCGD